ncbi:MAG: hypothetical protein ACTSUV_03025 [Candidatus Ranarchaeia archaeon]
MCDRKLRLFCFSESVTIDKQTRWKDYQQNSGRLDVLVRCIQTALSEPEFYSILQRMYLVIFQENKIVIVEVKLRKSEFKPSSEYSIYKELSEFLHTKKNNKLFSMEKKDLNKLLDNKSKKNNLHNSNIYVLEENGEYIGNISEDFSFSTFIIGDQNGFSPTLLKKLKDMKVKFVSNGKLSYLSSQCTFYILSESLKRKRNRKN